MNDSTRFTKLDGTGSPLPIDAADWAGVLDTTTQLIWPKDVLDKRMTFKQAQKAAAKTDVCGQPGRLPTVEELFSLADRTRFNPAIDTDFFPGTQSNWHWTSTPDASSPESYAWIVYFDYGYAGIDHRVNSALVRAVRSARASQ